MKETGLVVTEEREFFSRDKSKLSAHFGNLGLSHFPPKEHKQQLLNLILHHMYNLFGGNFESIKPA